MSKEAYPKLSLSAAKLWAAIPPETCKHLVSNVWCGNCLHDVTITEITGTVKAGNLILFGKCAICNSVVATMIGPEQERANGDGQQT